MNFKTWLKTNETVRNSAGIDTQPTQTNQATDDASKSLMTNPAFASVQSKLTGASGSPSAQRNQLINFTTSNFKSAVPRQVAPLTSPAPVAFNIQNDLGLNLGIPKPKFSNKR